MTIPLKCYIKISQNYLDICTFEILFNSLFRVSLSNSFDYGKKNHVDQWFPASATEVTKFPSCKCRSESIYKIT